jgi:hypothetical protein
MVDCPNSLLVPGETKVYPVTRIGVNNNLVFIILLF